MSRPKDLNPPSHWNMRIWDDDKKEWFCQSDKDALTYYGFDITGGETTEFQGLPKWHPDRHLIWEQSTGLKDKNGIEVYEGDLVKQLMYVLKGKECFTTWLVRWNHNEFCYDLHRVSGALYGDSMLSTCESEECEVIGNIHESGGPVENSNKLA